VIAADKEMCPENKLNTVSLLMKIVAQRIKDKGNNINSK
jgi:hypothetical protein